MLTTYGYNAAGDLETVVYNDGTPGTTYTYDRQGRRSQVVQNGITTILTYDDANQLLTESYDTGLLVGLSVINTYNNSFKRDSLSLGGIARTYAVSYGYDAAGRLEVVNSGINGAVYSYLLGKVARGGEMQMYCRQPCEDFRRSESEQGRNVDGGGIVCCGGVKFICTWGADKEKNAKAKEIAQRCLKEHERTHLPSNECNSCALGPVAPRNTKQDKAFCEEEVAAYGAGKACFEAAKSECGNDADCLESVERLRKNEEDMQKNMQAWCKHFDRPKN